MTSEKIHLVGFGSQGAAWAQCMRASGWDVSIYLGRKGPSYSKALELGFLPQLLSELPGDLLKTSPASPAWIALLCPDTEIPKIYTEFIESSPVPLRLILAHGYAVYAQELKVRTPLHQVFLLAPKSIGPKLLQNFLARHPKSHSLVAAICPGSFSPDYPTHLKIAQALGFHETSLVTTSFEKEAIGDLISEQGLLCGGIFNLLDWTVQAMEAAQIPPALIREECLTELELVAGLIREKGPATALSLISQAAQAGTIAIRERLELSGFKAQFDEQIQSIHSRKFATYFRSGKWKDAAEELKVRLSSLEQPKQPEETL